MDTSVRKSFITKCFDRCRSRWKAHELSERNIASHATSPIFLRPLFELISADTVFRGFREVLRFEMHFLWTLDKFNWKIKAPSF